jgi:aquaporin Z
MRPSEHLRRNYPEYLIEAAALGAFMVSAGVFTVLIDQPDSIVRAFVPDDDVRRALIGIAMGLTAIAIVYSPWGQRSGAHMNPALTLTFLRLGRVAPADAAFYTIAQFAGGLLGVLIVRAAFGEQFTSQPVNWVATLPGPDGVATAFLLEAAISFGLVMTVLAMNGNPKLQKTTGIACGVLVATYITLEAPYSGMSMNPARTFASAAPAAIWQDIWLYFVAPPLGMLAAAEVYTRLTTNPRGCAKWRHGETQRCIHCEYLSSKKSGKLV